MGDKTSFLKLNIGNMIGVDVNQSTIQLVHTLGLQRAPALGKFVYEFAGICYYYF